MVSIKQLEKKLEGKFQATNIQIHTNYIIKLGKSGTINLLYKNNDFVKLCVDGLEKDKILEALKGLDKTQS